MKIGIIGVNKISKFYAIIFAEYGHQVIFYENSSPINNWSIEKLILEKNFYERYIKDLKVFKEIHAEDIKLEIIEKFFLKENKINEKFVYVKDYSYQNSFNFERIPNIEIVQLNSTSINQIKMTEDLLIVDTPDFNLLKQIDLIKLNNWISIYITANNEDYNQNFQITKNGKYSIFGINENQCTEIFVNTKENNKNEVLKIIKKIYPNYKIEDEQHITKYDKYSYKNIAIINTALVEYNNPYRDYSLLLQIIENTQDKKIFSKLDIYSDIKRQVI